MNPHKTEHVHKISANGSSTSENRVFFFLHIQFLFTPDQDQGRKLVPLARRAAAEFARRVPQFPCRTSPEEVLIISRLICLSRPLSH